MAILEQATERPWIIGTELVREALCVKCKTAVRNACKGAKETPTAKDGSVPTMFPWDCIYNPGNENYRPPVLQTGKK